MENTSASPKTDLTRATMSGGDAVNRTLSHGEVALKRAICNHPGMALAISAGIGVLIACLIKRR